MGRAARLREAGVTGPGIGSGNSQSEQLKQMMWGGQTKFARFSDRAYAINKSGTFFRAKIMVQTKRPPSGQQGDKE